MSPFDPSVAPKIHRFGFFLRKTKNVLLSASLGLAFASGSEVETYFGIHDGHRLDQCRIEVAFYPESEADSLAAMALAGALGPDALLLPLRRETEDRVEYLRWSRLNLATARKGDDLKHPRFQDQVAPGTLTFFAGPRVTSYLAWDRDAEAPAAGGRIQAPPDSVAEIFVQNRASATSSWKTTSTRQG
jgi:hypothetical protein